MIYIKELISDEAWYGASMDQKFNLQQLHYKLNYIRVLYNKPMMVNSGFRTYETHLKIYKKINDRREGMGKERLRIPKRSNHLFGAAADIFDPYQSLQNWVDDNIDVLERLNLHCESFEFTPSWCHFQIYPPKSGARFFNP